MNRNLKAVFFILLVLCASCHKIEVNNFTGTYSYKTTGTVKATTSEISIDHSLPNEIGTMHILKNKSSDNYDVTIIMNDVGGGIYTAYGNIDGNEITLAPYQRPLDLKLLALIGKDITVTCTGSGKLKDGVLLLTQNYIAFNGNVIVSGKDITTIAELNE